MSDIVDLWKALFYAIIHISSEDLKYLAWFFCAFGIPVAIGVIVLVYILNYFGV